MVLISVKGIYFLMVLIHVVCSDYISLEEFASEFIVKA